jgi:Tfp pilus assembly protein PilF
MPENSLRLLLVALFCIAACSEAPGPVDDGDADPTFVGSEKCASCHDAAFEEWTGSHHQLAMQIASPETVLGSFDDATLEYSDTTTRFLRDGARFVAETANERGDPQSYEITHAFGITPLQQYLVDAPGGKKQALAAAWDTRPESEGGQRWYSLYPDELVDHEDPLHWTGRYYNWNYMCAECHSTNVSLGYDLDTNAFNTTFDEISVGCEACHGPGSVHIAQAEDEAFDSSLGLPVDLDDKSGAVWIMNPETGIAERSSPNDTRQQPESCGRCHARRSIIAATYEYGRPLTDTHMVSLLEENLYYPDGRIQDEVYVYGSFVQSKMYAAGVTCSDCHNAHTGNLHAGPNPNDTCAQCHLVTKFAADDHAGTGSSNCVGCHMPATTYMGVDDRRDHSFRLPDTSTDPAHYGSTIAAGRAGGANDLLLRSIEDKALPAIVRATMLTLLEPVPPGPAADTITAQFEDPDPLVRIAALRAVRNVAPAIRMRTGSQLLRDPVRGVRMEAALTYAEFRDLLPIEDSRAFPEAADEYREAMLAAANTPDAALGLAEFENRLGNSADALRMYRHALVVGPNFAPAYHAYGLSLVRSGAQDEALENLRTAAELAPESPRYAYVFGVALNSLGDSDAAVDILGSAHQRFEIDFDIAWALATIHRDRGERAEARTIAEELNARYPESAQVLALLNSLEE